jgi:hypothetical protein
MNRFSDLLDLLNPLRSHRRSQVCGETWLRVSSLLRDLAMRFWLAVCFVARGNSQVDRSGTERLARC